MPDPDPTIQELLPLRTPTFYILLALSTGEKHGYAILKEVEALSAGRVQLSTGTLYEALARLHEQNLIEQVEGGEGDEGQDSHPGRPRKTYRLSHFGLQVLKAEAERLRRLSSTALKVLGLESQGDPR